MTIKTGKPKGRPKGSRDKKSAALRLAVRSGVTPLEYMLSVLNHDNKKNQEGDIEVTPAMRMDAARTAAPYVHARLQSVVVSEKPYEGDPNSITNEQLAGIIARSGELDDAPEEESERTTH